MAINFTKTVLKKNNNSDKKRKYALCFRPVATDGLVGEPEHKYYTVGNKNGEANSVLLEEKGKNIEELGLRCGKKGRGRLSRALRAVFFQASLVRTYTLYTDYLYFFLILFQIYSYKSKRIYDIFHV